MAMARALAVELAGRGIRVNAVLPGAADTPMLRAGPRRGIRSDFSDEGALADLAGRHPMGRIGMPNEVVEVIGFLADSGRSGFVTGQSFVVDGGATARLRTE